MKKTFAILIVLALISSCSKESEENITTEEEAIVETSAAALLTPSVPVNGEEFSFNKNSLAQGCNNNNPIICAINLVVKCSISPKFGECDKKKMPNFIFMEDDYLARPTEQSYHITKVKPISSEMLEIHTQSQCNGNFFGLCQGNVIYVMNLKNNEWVVKDIYAIAQ